MIRITPINSNISQTYYNTLKFSFNPTTLTVNITGTFLNQYIQKHIMINKSTLLISSTVLFNSLTILYTYLTIDLNNFTYTSSISRINSNESYNPEFLLFLDNSLNIINDIVNLPIIVNNNKAIYQSTTTYISTTANISLQSFNSLSSNTSNLAYTSLYSFYSLNAAYVKNLPSLTNIDNKINNIFDIQFSYLSVSTGNPNYSSESYRSHYNITTKELFVYISGTWQKVVWQNFVKTDRLYKEGKLRINPSTTALEIQSADGTWHEIIPTIGKVFEPQDYGYIYYVAPNQSVTLGYGPKIPIIATNNISYKAKIRIDTYENEWTGILPSGLLIYDGYCDLFLQEYYWNIKTLNVSNNAYIPIIKSVWNNWFADQIINISIYNNYMYIIGYGVYGVDNFTYEYAYGSFPTNGYYLGRSCRSNTTISAYALIKRTM